MSVIAPPPPARPEPDAGVIADARRRRRRRHRGRAGAALIALLVLAGGVYAASDWGGAGAGSHATGGIGDPQRCPDQSLGVVAFTMLDTGALETVDLRDCRTHVIVRGGVGTGAPAFSPDGRYVAFPGGWVATTGGPVHHTPGTEPTFSPDGRLVGYGSAIAPVGGGAVERLPATFLAWVPHGGGLLMQARAGLADAGALELRAPDGTTRALTPAGWQSWFGAVSPDGRTVVVEHFALLRGRKPPAGGQLWVIDIATGARRLIYSEPPSLGGPFLDVAFAADSRWVLFAPDLGGSADAPADGLTNYAVSAQGGRLDKIAAFIGGNDAWCGSSLVYVIDNDGRSVTDGDGIATTSPPAWSSRAILPAKGATSFSEFACRPGGGGGAELALAGGPSSQDLPFGHEDRSIWLAPARPGARAQRIAATVPPRGDTDELPMWSANGRWLLFVRTRPSNISGQGTLEALDLSSGRLVGPIAPVGFTTNYYGTYHWSGQIAWYRQ
jgi:Tol biopolymer transport system component